MEAMNSDSLTPSHRQNRRRERPGLRTRRTVSRKANIRADYSEGILEAYDPSVYLPSDRARPSPLLRESIHQTWQRWKQRADEEQALAEMNRLQAVKALEMEQQRLYGGSSDDDELQSLGILNSEDASLPDAVSSGIPQPQESFVLVRRRNPRGTPRHQSSTWISLPLHLSFSKLSDDSQIANLISYSTTTANTITKPTIQHRRSVHPPLRISLDDTPQSLPLEAAPAFGESHHTLSPLPIPTSSHQDWEFIDTISQSATPFSEPETWIFLGDDS